MPAYVKFVRDLRLRTKKEEPQRWEILALQVSEMFQVSVIFSYNVPSVAEAKLRHEIGVCNRAESKLLKYVNDNLGKKNKQTFCLTYV